MHTLRPALLSGLVIAAYWIANDHQVSPQTKENQPKQETSGDSKQEKTERTFPVHSYNNSVNILSEHWIHVTDNQAKPATRFPSTGEKEELLSDVKFEIVWTSPEDYEWNYSVPELHDGKDLFDTKYPSSPLFFERKLNVSYKKLLEVSIPDTPYSFYILDGKLSPYFYDSKKDVIWRLNSKDMDTLFARMNSISVSPRKLELMAPGGDMAEFLTIDFSSRNASPTISTWQRFDGP